MSALAQIEPQASQVAVMSPDMMIDRALASGASVEIIERLFALKEKVDAHNAKKAFDAAVSAAKAMIGPIVKNRDVDFVNKSNVRTNYKHEDFAEIARTVDPILGQHGLSYRFHTRQGDGGRITVTCILAHRDGHAEETGLSASPDESGNKNSIQAIGSTITYLQRYTLKAALGLAASNDDDARSAGGDETINDDEVSELLEGLAETHTSLLKFLKFFKIERIEDLRRSSLGKARAIIKDRREEQQRAAR